MTSNNDLFNEEVATDETSESTHATTTPGQLLAQAREQQGLSQQQVADSLRLRLAVVQSIEADEYEKLASATFVRGYLRSMAKLLEVDEKQVFAAYEQLGYAQTDNNALKMQSFSRRKVKDRNENRLKWVSYIIIVVVLALVLIWWWQDSEFSFTTITGSDDAPTQQQAEALRDSTSSLTQVVRPAAVEPSPANSTAEPLTEAEAQAAGSSSNTMDAIAAEGADENSEAAPEMTANADETVLEGAGDATTSESDAAPSEAAEPRADDSVEDNAAAVATEQLVLEFSQACWVKVTDGTGENIAIGVKAEGYRMPLTGEAPFDLILCRPEAVTLTYNGNNVSLDNYVRDRSVALTLD